MSLHHTLGFLFLGSLFLSLSPSAQAGAPRCFLHGIITPEPNYKQKSSVSDMIRLNFDAAEKEKCELMMVAYCRYNVQEKHYSPTRLKGSFKADVEKEDEQSYRFDKKCKLFTEDDILVTPINPARENLTK